jgi:hypothetical protein
MKNKAQAAMEFLMTYGWAILVVLVVIGALAYFGILKPEISLPERCELQQGFYCKDFRIADVTGGNDNISFTFENGRGKGMMLTGLTAQGTNDISHIICGGPGRVYATCDSTGIVDDLIDGPACQWSGKQGLHIENGLSADVVVLCVNPNALDGLSASGKKKFNLGIIWYSDDSTVSYSHTMEGQVLAAVEN